MRRKGVELQSTHLIMFFEQSGLGEWQRFAAKGIEIKKKGWKDYLRMFIILIDDCWIRGCKSYLTYSNKATTWLWSCERMTSKGCIDKKQQWDNELTSKGKATTCSQTTKPNHISLSSV